MTEELIDPNKPKFILHSVMKTRGEYKKGFPEGAIVHFTSGRYEKGDLNAIESIDIGVKNGYAYWCIGRDGTVVRGHPLRRWGYHAGLSYRKGVGLSVHRSLIGIEMCNAGKVTPDGKGNFKTWWGGTLAASEVRHVPKSRYKEEEAGYYHRYSDEQQKALVNLLMWLRQNSDGVFDFSKVLGHDEVAMPKGRKNDPGGALLVGMPEFRELLAAEAKLRGIK